MSRKADPKLIGAFVLGGAGLLLLAIILLADGSFWRDRPTYTLYFEGSTTGLQVGSPVVFRGVKIGSVESIGLSIDKALEVSDHNPVWAAFRPWETRQVAGTPSSGLTQ